MPPINLNILARVYKGEGWKEGRRERWKGKGGRKDNTRESKKDRRINARKKERK